MKGNGLNTLFSGGRFHYELVFSVINKIRRPHSDDKGSGVTKKLATATTTVGFSTSIPVLTGSGVQ